MQTKICNKCKQVKDALLFAKNKANRDGLQRRCKQCNKEYRDNPENKKRQQDHLRTWNAAHPEAKRAYDLKFREENAEWLAEYYREYHVTNRERRNAQQAARLRKARAEDPQKRVSDCLRANLYQAIKKGFKAGSAVRDLGCSIKELCSRLESQFTEGMTWENRGKGRGKWNIDHIIPLDYFDLTKRDQFLQACHYTNLQPLWSEINSSKAHKLPDDFQRLIAGLRDCTSNSQSCSL